jgi:hypothetical protein
MTQLIKPNRLVLEDYYKDRNLIDATKNNYIRMFIRIQNLLKLKKINPPIIHRNIDAVLELLDEQYLLARESNFEREIGLKPVISLKFLSILIHIIKNKDDALQVNEAIKLYEKRQSNYTASKTKKQLNKIQLSYEELTGVIYDPKTTDIDYILMYLFITLGIRLTDITFVFLQEQKPSDNYMYINEDGHVVYVRNNYKLKTQFGTLSNTITDKRFINIIQTFITNGKEFLFTNKFNNSYNRQTIANYVKQRTTKLFGTGISESLMYKIIIDYLTNIGDEKRQIELAQSRPHNISTQATYYQ